MIDTHCHLNFEAFFDDFSDVIKRGEKVGVTKFIVPGAKLDSSERAFLLSCQFSNVFAAVGVHPHHVKDFNKNTLLILKDLLNKQKVVALGEVGIDYKNDLEVQLECLRKQLDLAVEVNKPCIFHCRDAHGELDEFLSGYLKSKKLSGVFHCFTGNTDHLKKVLDMGFFVSFTGNVTFDHSLDELLINTPIERLLLETDSPYMTPVPIRGERNEPKNLLLIAQYISEIKNTPLNELLERSSINAEGLFNI